jgi:hypothetical protein
MGLRIGELEVQQIYLGTTAITEIFINDENIAPVSTTSSLLQELGAKLLTEAGYSILLERRPLLLTEALEQLTTETGDYITAEAS